jgi:hypothetical protein
MNKLKNFYIKPYAVSDNPLSENQAYLDMPISGISKDPASWTKAFAKNHEQVSLKEINAFGFRSDEFKSNHDGLHILFLGCSYTWGTGLYLNEVWSKILYKKISNKTETSGFFNLGVPGDSVHSSITNAFKYFKNFGNPSVIFFNIQNINRFYAEDEQNHMLYRSHINDTKVLNLMAYQHYYALEQYCRSNNILLISFTWYLGHDQHPLISFQTFYHINIDNITNFVLEYKEKNSHVKESMVARDGKHLGTAYHEYWAIHAYSKYDKINKKDWK